jgi:hypothetical protein
MNRLVLALLFSLSLPLQAPWGQALDQKAAVALAEKFIAEHGYTSPPPADQIIERLYPDESDEHFEIWKILVNSHRNTLLPKAIGARMDSSYGSRWMIAFDGIGATNAPREFCYIVIMNVDGSNIRMEHRMGPRKNFLGFK